MLLWLSVWSERQMICIWCNWCHCHAIVSCSSEIQSGLTFLVPVTQVDLEKCPLNGRVSVCTSLANVVQMNTASSWLSLTLPANCWGYLREIPSTLEVPWLITLFLVHYVTLPFQVCSIWTICVGLISALLLLISLVLFLSHTVNSLRFRF